MYLSLLFSLRKAQPPGTLIPFGQVPAPWRRGLLGVTSSPGVCAPGIMLWPGSAGGSRPRPVTRAQGNPQLEVLGTVAMCPFYFCLLLLLSHRFPQSHRNSKVPTSQEQRGARAPPGRHRGLGLCHMHLSLDLRLTWRPPGPSQAQLFLGVTSEKPLGVSLPSPGSTLARDQRGARPALLEKQLLPSPAESRGSEPGL